MKKFFNWKLIALLILFTLSRAYIYLNPPAEYSDVRADYERYANMWRYGTPPYLKHLYEYPPATIPLLQIPLDLDQNGIGKYYPNYRAQILAIDIVFFLFLVASFSKLPWKKKITYQGIVWYIIMTTLAKNFFYEGIDLAFTGAIFASFLSLVWFKKDSLVSAIVLWSFFWLSTAIKFMTLPLMVPLWLTTRSNAKRDYIAPIIGFLLIWGIPLAMYGTSLQVSFVYNNARPIKYASFPAHIIKWVNLYTHTETQRMVAPDFEYQGPVSEVVAKVDKVAFPLALLAFLGWSLHTLLMTKYAKTKAKSKNVIHLIKKEIFTPKLVANQDKLYYLLKMYGVYIFVLFLSAKIFSQPFHIWYMPFVVTFPFVPQKKKYLVIFLMLLMILLDMTEYLHVKIDSELIKQMRDALRFIPMFILVWLFAQNQLSVQDDQQ